MSLMRLRCYRLLPLRRLVPCRALLLAVWLLSILFMTIMDGSKEAPWPLRLLLILAGYSTVAAPTALFILWVKRKYDDVPVDFRPQSRVVRWAKAFALGQREYALLGGESTRPTRTSATVAESCWTNLVWLLFYSAGIQATLVTMGFMQERIMTQGYVRINETSSSPALQLQQRDKFGDAQFLVLCNRIVALAICVLVLAYRWSSLPPHVPPFYSHAYTSFSNTISSWCQYEALKYVSFPVQTICKASKVVVTMAMGRVVRGQKYTRAEYACSFGVAVGAMLFLLFSSPSRPSASPHRASPLLELTTAMLPVHGEATFLPLRTAAAAATSSSSSFFWLSGLALMTGYLLFDAFTLNWQKALFDTRPSISKIQMMLGVNLFSAVLCLVSLLEQGTLSESLAFINYHRDFYADVFVLSLSGATGQLFIYATIERFGPIVFAVIMTVRQMLSIVLSAVYYGHPMSPAALIGFLIVFGFIFLDIYRRYGERRRKVVGTPSSPHGHSSASKADAKQPQ